ncbi:MAG: 5-formyltetrahydrofolate cyclo-ligase [Devosiaceae bacterium]|nr:5-formyltetrahydrofolate cyclo-ligase [Devosiaceae bacterium MH13]
MLTSSVSSKADLRAAALAQRDGVPSGARAAASAQLAERFSFEVSGRRVAGYHAIGSELDPAPLLARAASQGAELCLPVLLDRETMVFRAWAQGDPLIPVGFGTQGPTSAAAEVVPDLILAPLAGFTAQGQRIGYGKGHYDRALAKLAAAGVRPALVGLAFDAQQVPAFPAEPHDVPLDGVLTPTALHVFDGGARRLAPLLSRDAG